MKYNVVSNEDEANLTAFIGGKMFTATQDHPNYQRIVAKVLAGDESVVDLFDVALTVHKYFQSISDRVTVSNGHIFFDGDEVDNALTAQILRFMEEGLEFMPLVNFFEKIATNPLEHSREQLYRFLDHHNFTITPLGDFVGYKGVKTTDADCKYESISTGPAIVDGVAVDGHVPNPIGGIIEMARSAVAHDPRVACSTGLHVGTYEYASGFAQGAVLEVHVNPRDVVSVPTDSHDQKIRTCRYLVVGPIEEKYAGALADDYGDSEDTSDDDYTCNECGCDYDECDCDE